jgi:periplasmic protein TonB
MEQRKITARPAHRRYSAYSFFLSVFLHSAVPFLLLYLTVHNVVSILPPEQPITIRLERAPLEDFVSPRQPVKPAKPKEEQKKEEIVPPVMELSSPILPETILTVGQSSVGIDSTAIKAYTPGVVSASQLDDSLYKAYYQPLPEYPWLPRSMGIEGKVVVRVLVGPEGRVVDHVLVTVEGHPSFGLAAVQAVRLYKFPPPRSQGRPVFVWIEVPILFVLE